jgi:hypothetical protein
METNAHLDRKKKLELCRQVLLCVQFVREINAADAAVCMDLYPKGFNVVSAVRPSSKIAQVELNLIPPLVQPHRHCANERFYSSGGLQFTCASRKADKLHLSSGLRTYLIV